MCGSSKLKDRQEKKEALREKMYSLLCVCVCVGIDVYVHDFSK